MFSIGQTALPEKVNIAICNARFLASFWRPPRWRRWSFSCCTSYSGRQPRAAFASLWPTDEVSPLHRRSDFRTSRHRPAGSCAGPPSSPGPTGPPLTTFISLSVPPLADPGIALARAGASCWGQGRRHSRKEKRKQLTLGRAPHAAGRQARPLDCEGSQALRPAVSSLKSKGICCRDVYSASPRFDVGSDHLALYRSWRV
jgi:hypothetical protein